MSQKVSFCNGFFSLLLFLAFQGHSQTKLPDIFYRHYTGVLDTAMNLTFDIFSYNGQIEGYYYYGFHIPGTNGEYQYGKTIPVTGRIEGNNFTIQEAINSSSRFTGSFGENGNMTGKWIRQVYQKDIPFFLAHNLEEESLPLKAFHLVKEQPAIDIRRKNEVIPKAKIDILILYPEKSKSFKTQETIDHLISMFMINDPQPIKSPERFIENIASDFFSSYLAAAEGIENIISIASFNWEKTLSMEVLYNAHNLLSLRFKKQAYSGGSHALGIHENHVINLTTGSKLELHDFLEPGFEPKLNSMLNRKFRRLNGLQIEEQLRPAGFLIDQIEFSQNFYINNDGIGFYYNVYEIASFSSGTTELFIPFHELSPLMRKDHPFSWISF